MEASETADLVRRLEEALGDPAEDLETAHALGWFYQLRGSQLGTKTGISDRSRARTLLAPIYRVEPSKVPQALRSEYEREWMGLAKIGMASVDRAVESDDMKVLSLGISYLDRARGLAPVRHPQLALVLLMLGIALNLRFDSERDMADLDRAIESLQSGEMGLPRGTGARSHALFLLGKAYWARFEGLNEPGDLNSVIDRLRQAVDLAEEGDLGRAEYLAWLGRALWARYQRARELVDLDEAQAVALAACEAEPVEPAARFGNLRNASLLHWARFRRFGEVDALRQVIQALDAAKRVPGITQDDLAFCESQLGLALTEKFDLSGELEDSDSAISWGRSALGRAHLTSEVKAECQARLGMSLSRRFERDGELGDIDEAISLLLKAASCTSTTDTTRAEHFAELGTAMSKRFDRLQAVVDNDNAILHLEHAVQLATLSDEGYPAHLTNLGNALLVRFRRTGSLIDLNRAIEVGERAVGAAASDSPTRPRRCSNLAAALLARFDKLGKELDLDRAVTLLQGAVDDAGRGSPQRPLFHTNLCGALMDRFRCSHSRSDLERAVQAGQDAVDETPEGHPELSYYRSNLGLALRARFENDNLRQDLEKARDTFRAGAILTSGAPVPRVHCARGWGWSAALLGDKIDAVDAYKMAVDLVGLMVPAWLGRDDKESQLKTITGLGSDAAAACLTAGDPEQAVRLLEGARGVMLAHALDARTDVADLAGVRPDLAQAVSLLLQDISRPNADLDAGLDPNANRRRAASEDLDRILRDVRSMDGFSDFLRPPPLAKLLPTVDEGMVVVINVTTERCDGLILSPDGVDSLRLPELTALDATEQVIAFMIALERAQSSDGADAEKAITSVLEWLWDRVAGPVFNRLGLGRGAFDDRGIPVGDWPRITWCPTGPLAFLPLHAAGYHETRFASAPLTVLDRAMSSTTPTLRSHRRHRHNGGGRDIEAGREDRMLVVAMPTTPGLENGDLPGATIEAVYLSNMLPGSVDVLGLDNGSPATKDAVLRQLSSHAWAHFCCHGASRPLSPWASSLLLEDYQDNPLSVLDIADSDLSNARLAFLSACSTAESGVLLPDEPIHLSAAFQLAGYRNVIATLWSIDDRDAVNVTKTVYQNLTKHTSGPCLKLFDGWPS